MEAYPSVFHKAVKQLLNIIYTYMLAIHLNTVLLFTHVNFLIPTSYKSYKAYAVMYSQGTIERLSDVRRRCEVHQIHEIIWQFWGLAQGDFQNCDFLGGIYVYIYIYIYMNTHTLHVYIYIYIHIYICVFVIC